MKKYQWNNQNLKRQSRKYNWATLVCVIIIAIGAFALPQYTPISVLIILMVIAGGLQWYVSKIQSNDKKLRDRKAMGHDGA